MRAQMLVRQAPVVLPVKLIFQRLFGDGGSAADRLARRESSAREGHAHAAGGGGGPRAHGGDHGGGGGGDPATFRTLGARFLGPEVEAVEAWRWS